MLGRHVFYITKNPTLSDDISPFFVLECSGDWKIQKKSWARTRAWAKLVTDLGPLRFLYNKDPTILEDLSPNCFWRVPETGQFKKQNPEPVRGLEPKWLRILGRDGFFYITKTLTYKMNCRRCCLRVPEIGKLNKQKNGILSPDEGLSQTGYGYLAATFFLIQKTLTYKRIYRLLCLRVPETGKLKKNKSWARTRDWAKLVTDLGARPARCG